MQPFDTKIEDTILAHAMRNVAFVKQATRVCRAHHFAGKERAWIWNLIYEQWTKHKEPLSTRILVRRLRRDFSDVEKRKPYVAQVRKLAQLRPKNPKASMAELERFVRATEVHIALEESAKALGRGDVDAAEVAIAKASRSPIRQRNYTHVKWIEELDARQEQRKHEHDHPEEFTVIPLGIPSIDRALKGGLRKGELAVIMGTTGRGKSMCLTNVTQSAIARGYRVVYFGFEMNARQLASRQDSRWSGIQYDRFETYNFAPSDLRRLERRTLKAKRRFANRLHIISMPIRAATMDDVNGALDDLRTDHQFEADLIVFDSVDHLRARETYGGEYRLQQSEVYWAAKSLAEEDGYAVFTSTHAGREWAKRIATAEASSEAYDKSRIADVIMTINDPSEMRRDKRRGVTVSDDDEDSEGDGETVSIATGSKLMELYLAKNRSGGSHFKVPIECDFSRISVREARGTGRVTSDDDDE